MLSVSLNESTVHLSVCSDNTVRAMCVDGSLRDSHVGQAVPYDLGDGLEQMPKVPAFDETFM